MKKLLFLSVLFLTTLLSAAGSSCSNAIDLSLPSETETSLQNRTWSGGGWNKSYYYYTYYKFIPSSDGELVIQTTGMDNDSDAWLYDDIDECESWWGNPVASDTRNNNDIYITYTLSAGTTYYLPVRNYTDDDDSFRLYLNFQLPSQADLALSQTASPSPNPVDVDDNVTFSFALDTNGPDIADPNIDVKIEFNKNVVIESALQTSGGGDFTCTPSSGALASGSVITCTKANQMVSGAPTKAFTVIVRPQEGGGTFTMSASVTSATADPDTSNNTLDMSVEVNAPTVVENADDLCYDEILTNGFCFGAVNFMCTVTTPIRNLSDSTLSNVQVALGTSSLFSAFGDCGVDGASGNCDDASRYEFMMFSAFNNGIEYDLPNFTPYDEHTTYNSAFFSFFESPYDWVATYQKDGIVYQGSLQQCEDQSVVSGERDFVLRNQQNLTGDVKVIGNTVLCVQNHNGECVEPSGSNSNAELDLEKAPTSSVNIELPDGAEVKYARIYWQGRETATSSNSGWSNAHRQEAMSIKLKKDSGSYVTLNADIGDFTSTDASNKWINIYSASANAIGVVTGSGTYSVDTQSFYTSTGDSSDGLGNYGAWILVIVYKDPNTTTMRNVSIFDGYKIVSADNASVNVEVNGFLTPKEEDVHSDLYVFTAEGDKYISGDHLKMAGKRFNTSLIDIAPTSNNAFDSRIDTEGTRNPDLGNNNGIDIQKYNVGVDGHDIITNRETGAKFQFTSTQDTYFPSVVVFSTQIYAPRLCYDYTYGQGGLYQTAQSIKPPIIDGTFATSQPLDVKLYFKNLEGSDIEINDLTIDIVDINATQAKYKRESTSVTLPNSASINHVSDTGRAVSDSYNKNIPIGQVDAHDYFYTYYSLDAQSSQVDMPLHAILRYNLSTTIDGENIILQNIQTDIEDMEVCQNNGDYNPIPGRFNIVHNDFYDSSSGNYYFNLPTQIAGRYVDEYTIESMDPSNLDTTKDVPETTVVALQMVDLSGFHYTSATCTDLDAYTIGERLWVIFDKTSGKFQPVDANNMRDKQLFERAVRNAAFRLSYNTADANGSLLSISEVTTGSYKIDNFPSFAGSECSAEFIPTTDSSREITTYCGNNGQGNGSGMSAEELKTCMECIYGLQTLRMCSRDNFAIRPSSFVFSLADTNNSNPVNGSELLVAANYPYKLETNATGYDSNNSVAGYSQSLNDALKYKWKADSARDANCNDISDTNLSISFNNGSAEQNTSHNQAGKYTLTLTDTEWSAVDYDPVLLVHHSAPSFKMNGSSPAPDCTLGSSNIFSSYNNLNGCNISSQYYHDTTLVNNDVNLRFYPYSFEISNTLKRGENNVTVSGSRPFVYMSNLSTSEAMALHVETTIKAVGKDSSTPLSNFVDGCFAEPLNITINKSDTNNTNIVLVSRLHNRDTNGTTITADDLNDTIDAGHTAQNIDFAISGGYFTKALSGELHLRTNINFARDKNKPQNPEKITFTTLSAKNTTAPFNADGVANKNTEGSSDINKTVYFYYGRANTGKKRYEVSSDNESQEATLYYEIYCFGTTNNNQCNTDLLPSKTRTHDIRWFQNTDHATANDGKVTGVEQKGSNVVAASTVTHEDPVSKVDLSYDGTRGYPYSTTMLIDASEWLIYHPNDPTVTKNEFQVEFYKTASSWAGEHETETTTKNVGNTRTSRRVMW